jgi:hypothetical protein
MRAHKILAEIQALKDELHGIQENCDHDAQMTSRGKGSKRDGLTKHWAEFKCDTCSKVWRESYYE